MKVKANYAKIVDVNSVKELLPLIEGFRHVEIENEGAPEIVVYLYKDFSIDFQEEKDWEMAEKVMEDNNVVLEKAVIDGTECLVGDEREVYRLIELLAKNFYVKII